MTEVKPKNLKTQLTKASLKLSGYELLPNKNCFINEGRGVCIYIKEDMAGSCKEIVCEVGAESVWVKIQNADSTVTKFGCLYRSPNATETTNTKLCQFMKSLDTEENDLIIVGDFNHPEVDWPNITCRKDDDHPAKVFLESVRDGLLIQHVTEATRWREGQASSTLDLIFTNKEGLISDINVSPPLGKSDHGVIIFKMHCQTTQEKQKKPQYLYNKGNYNQIREDLDIDWESELDGKNVIQWWENFKSKLSLAASNNIPKVSQSKRKWKRPSWMSTTAIAKVKKKHTAWKRYLATKDGQAYQLYARARNQAKWECQKARKAYEKDIAKQSKQNPKSFWKYVNSKLKSKENVADLHTNEGTASTDLDKANVLSTFFKQVFTQEDTSNIPEFEERVTAEPLDDVKFTEEDVLMLLKEININKSQGPDLLHPRLLFEAREVIARPLYVIFRKSIDTGILPKEWKEANISPIYKNKGNRHEATNYRPVSLTSVICKLLEKLIRKDIVAHMKLNNLFSTHQHGFLEGRSCLSNLLTTMEEWTRIIEDKGSIECIYMDFMKAFDSVPHQKLLHKLKAYNITGKIHKWIEEFLIGRQQRVVVNSIPSKNEAVTSGVPQGSVLGPVLFLIFINDLPDTLDVAVQIFADDTKIFHHVNDKEDQSKLQENLTKLETWAETWQMRFHPQKCKVMHIGKDTEEFQYTMRSDGKSFKLEYTKEERDLGVIVDNSLSFEQHCDAAINKANRVLGVIRRSFKYIDRDVILTLYKALVRPHLEYANTVWCPKLKRITKSLESVQRRATRMVPDIAHLTYQERLQCLKLPSLVYRRRRGDMVQVYKILHHEYDLNSEQFFTSPNDSRTRGHSYKVFKERAESSIRRNFFSLRVTELWNELPERVAAAPNIDTFKERLDDFWSKKDWLYNYESID